MSKRLDSASTFFHKIEVIVEAEIDTGKKKTAIWLWRCALLQGQDAILFMNSSKSGTVNAVSPWAGL